MRSYLRVAVISLVLALLALPLGQTSIFDTGEDVAFVAFDLAIDEATNLMAAELAVAEVAYLNAFTDSQIHPLLNFEQSGATRIETKAQPSASRYNDLKMPRARSTRSNSMGYGVAGAFT